MFDFFVICSDLLLILIFVNVVFFGVFVLFFNFCILVYGLFFVIYDLIDFNEFVFCFYCENMCL